MASLRLLTTGDLTDATLRAHAERLIDTPPDPPPDSAMLDGFAHWQVRATPYANARDAAGATTGTLSESDPFGPDAPPPPPILRDGDWLRLQGICGG